MTAFYLLMFLVLSGIGILFFKFWGETRQEEKDGELLRTPSIGYLIGAIFFFGWAIGCFLAMIGKLDAFLAYLAYLRTR